MLIIIIIRNCFVGFMDWCGLCESAAMVVLLLMSDFEQGTWKGTAEVIGCGWGESR